MAIKIIALQNNKTKFDITELVTDVGWSGDVKQHGRRLDINFTNMNGDGKKAVSLYLADSVFFYVDNKEVFRGFIHDIQTDHEGNQNLICYDQCIYLSKNFDTVRFENKKANAFLQGIFIKFGLKTGTFSDTGKVYARKVFRNTSLSNMATELLKEAEFDNKVKYKLFSDKGVIKLVSYKDAPNTNLVFEEMLSASSNQTLGDIATQVKITKGSLQDTVDTSTSSTSTEAYYEYVAKDAKNAAKYGVMQVVETIDTSEKETEAKRLAQQILAERSKVGHTLNVSLPGNASCMSGTKLTISSSQANAKGLYYITSDSHSWSGGEYTMSLELEVKTDANISYQSLGSWQIGSFDDGDKSDDTPKKTSGEYSHPLGADVFKISSKYGESRPEGPHRGVDFAARVGTPIYAVSSGTVVASGPASGYGYWVVIKDKEGLYWIYGHMNQYGFWAKKGEKVQQGQRFAIVGNAGQSSGPHLHLACCTSFPPNNYQNPADYFDIEGGLT